MLKCARRAAFGLCGGNITASWALVWEEARRRHVCEGCSGQRLAGMVIPSLFAAEVDTGAHSGARGEAPGGQERLKAS